MRTQTDAQHNKNWQTSKEGYKRKLQTSCRVSWKRMRQQNREGSRKEMKKRKGDRQNNQANIPRQNGEIFVA